MSKITKNQAIDALWRRGFLAFKLDTAQKKMYDLFYKSEHKVMTWLLSRRSGKTYTLCVLALEQCLREPRSIVKFASPTKIQVNNNVRPLFQKLLDDCPEDIKPRFSAKDYIYYFPNGSEIQLAGTDSGHAEKLRGGDSHIWFVDEAGSCDDLDNVVKSILLPTTLITQGKGVLASTPPSNPEHEFLGWIERAEANKSLTLMTIDDNPRLTEQQKEDLFKELGGKDTEAAQRELYCKIIRDPSLSVIPEFTSELESKIVKEWPRPPFFDCYTAMDIGFDDLTVVLFAYYDFRADKVVIEDELVMNGPEMKLNILSQEIIKKENNLWFNHLTGEPKKPYIRVSDVNKIVQNEISAHSDYQVNFLAAKKDDKDSALNTLRMMLSAEKIIINPRCETLIRHLRNVRWFSKKNHLKFAHGVDGSHFDAVDAIIYLVRTIIYTKNPYPAHYGLDMKDLFIRNPEEFNASSGGVKIRSSINNQLDSYKKLFNLKSRK